MQQDLTTRAEPEWRKDTQLERIFVGNQLFSARGGVDEPADLIHLAKGSTV